jgi:hypothetical protein
VATTLDLLSAFFATSPAARRAVRPLAATARVALLLDEGPAGFTVDGGAARLAAGPLPDPDFTLRLPAAAVARLVEVEGDDVGAIGIAFFQALLDREPSRRVRVTVEASTARLVSHGYLGVLALGGLKVGLFLLRRGLADPRRVIERLRGH